LNLLYQEQDSLFSIARPLFFRISATVTTVAMAERTVSRFSSEKKGMYTIAKVIEGERQTNQVYNTK
jgi:hypothetical protein